MGELCGYSVSNETYNTMPSTQLVHLDGEKTKHIKVEPSEDTLEYDRVNDVGEYLAGKCEITSNRDSCHSTKEKQMANKCIKRDKCFDSHSNLKKHMVDSHSDMKKTYFCIVW